MAGGLTRADYDYAGMNNPIGGWCKRSVMIIISTIGIDEWRWFATVRESAFYFFREPTLRKNIHRGGVYSVSRCNTWHSLHSWAAALPFLRLWEWPLGYDLHDTPIDSRRWMPLSHNGPVFYHVRWRSHVGEGAGLLVKIELGKLGTLFGSWLQRDLYSSILQWRRSCHR